MFAILFVAASLLTQAYIFRDLDAPDSNTEVNLEDCHRDPSPIMDATYGWTAKSDSSRTPKPAGDR